MLRLAKLFSLLSAALWLAACDPTADLDGPPADLGDFKLGHNIALVVEDVSVFAGSRQIEDEEWVEALQAASKARFGRYTGDRTYHISYAVRGYNVSPITVPTPGLPIPPSAINVHVRIWDDAKGVQLSDKPKEITIVDFVKGSGIGATQQEQVDFLAASVVKATEDWILENPDWLVFPAAATPEEIAAVAE